MVAAAKKKKKKNKIRPNPFSVPLNDEQLKFMRKASKEHKISMSKFLRKLIDQEMGIND